jgi:hypothetical protein
MGILGLRLGLVGLFVGHLKTLYFFAGLFQLWVRYGDIKRREMECVLKVCSGQFSIVCRNSTYVTEKNHEFLVPQRFDPTSFAPRLWVHARTIGWPVVYHILTEYYRGCSSDTEGRRSTSSSRPYTACYVSHWYLDLHISIIITF